MILENKRRISSNCGCKQCKLQNAGAKWASKGCCRYRISRSRFLCSLSSITSVLRPFRIVNSFAGSDDDGVIEIAQNAPSYRGHNRRRTGSVHLRRGRGTAPAASRGLAGWVTFHRNRVSECLHARRRRLNVFIFQCWFSATLASHRRPDAAIQSESMSIEVEIQRANQIW